MSSQSNKSTKHILFVGNCVKAFKILDLNPIDLIVTSPPYFNAPYDYKDLFNNYEAFLRMITDFANFFYVVMHHGGIAAINIDDMLIKGVKYPIISDTIKIFENIGYILHGRIIWKKPEGYIRISRRSGVLLQNPFPMYFYPDNLIESILIFQKPIKNNNKKENSIKYYGDVWYITNVLPIKGRLESNIAAFPEKLPRKLIKAFTNKGTWVCDPFLGSGTTMKVSRDLRRNSIGVELQSSLVPLIRKKSGFTNDKILNYLSSDEFILETISEQDDKFEEQSSIPINKDQFSLIKFALNQKKRPKNVQKYHLILLDCRRKSNALLNKKFERILDQLMDGRIIIIFYDPINNFKNELKIYELFDFLMRNNIRYRDKITIEHKNEEQWEILLRDSSKVIFKHCYYEIFLFQKGNYDYKSKTVHEKKQCLIDKQQFQKEKWFLSIWDFNSLLRSDCDPIVTMRLIELFLYNNEIIGTNFNNLESPKREFLVEKVDL